MPGTQRIASRTESGSRSGFSLTELLIASAIALVIMTGVASLFGVFGATASQSQAIAALNGRLRSTAWQLRQDLTGVTVDLVPWTRPESNSGYFELLEGPRRDTTLAISGSTATSNIEGDTDDILLFTTRAVGGPFVGRYDTGTIESDCAEVAWFCREAGTQPISGTKLYNLYRRQLLVMNYVGRAPFFTGNAAASVPVANLVSGATPLYDLSLRLDASSGNAVPNSLADLTKRENRCFLAGNASIRGGTFPFAVLTDANGRLPLNATFDDTDRVWEDVILTNMIAFDVRVFDPAARVSTVSSGTTIKDPLGPTGQIIWTGTNLYPGEPGYNPATANGASGVYVDLGWGGGAATAIGSVASWPPSGTTAFQTAGMQVSGTPTSMTLPVATYDTWSLHYEFNGVDEDGDGSVDEGTDGADNNSNNVPDDPAEYETSPPYPVPLRGVEVRIRCYEPTSKQIRQITIRHTFVKK